MNCMLDLETWGTRTGCAIRSIGAVVFTLSDNILMKESFYRNISESSCRQAGLNFEQGTIDWWAKQSKEAQASLLVEPKSLKEVVQDFNTWFTRQNLKYTWAQGAGFDPVLWEAASRAVGFEAPWKFFNVRDTRTVYDLAGLDARTVPRPGGVAHCALDDAVHQVVCLQEAWTMLHDVERMAARSERAGAFRGTVRVPVTGGAKPAAAVQDPLGSK